MRKIILIFIFTIGLFSTVNAQTNFYWETSAPDGNWRQGIASGPRWNPGGLWDEPGFGILHFGNNHQLSMTNNVSGTYNQHAILFDAGNTSTRTLSGNPVQFFDFSTVWPRIRNYSSTNHIVDLPIINGNCTDCNLELIASNGSITFENTISNNFGRGLYIYGNNAGVDANNRYIRINDEISGDGFLTIAQDAVGIINAAQTYTGETRIDKGELWIDANGSIASGSAIYLGNGGQPTNVAKLFLADADGGQNFTNAINVNDGNANTRYIGSLNSTGTNLLTGAITKPNGTELTFETVSTGILEVSGGMTSSNGNIYKTGPGTLKFSGTNFQGATTGQWYINEGTVESNFFPLGIMNATNRDINIGNTANSTLRITGTSGNYTGILTSSTNGGIIIYEDNSNNRAFIGTLNINADLTFNNKTTNRILSLSGNQNGTGKLIIDSEGLGAIRLTGANYTRTSDTEIVSGNFRINPPGAGTTFNSRIVLNGGILETTGIVAGRIFTSNSTLKLDSNSTINLATVDHTLTFDDSSSEIWTGLLTINNWFGTPGISGGADTDKGKIFVGVGGLSPTQLNQINFAGFTSGAMITAIGELVPTDYLIYYSKSPFVANDLNSWSTLSDGSGSNPTDFNNRATYIVQNGHSMITNADWILGGSYSVLNIENSASLHATNSISIPTTGTFQIDNGGTYIHDNIGIYSSTIFQGTENFGVTSNFELRNSGGITAAFNNFYGNFIINSSSLLATLNFGGFLQNINGNFILNNTNNQEIRLSAGTGGTLTVNGNFELNNNSKLILKQGTTAPDQFLIINGNANFNSGSFGFTSGASGGQGLFIVNGENFELTNNITFIGAVNPTGSSGFYFNRNGLQNVTFGHTFASGNQRNRFYFNSTQTILNEIYNGIVAQQTVNGSGASPLAGYSAWPIDSNDGINDLTILNPAGVTLRDNRKVGNDVIINNSGHLQVNSNINLVVTEDFTNISGTATFEDDASLIQVNGTTANNFGNITYKRTTRDLKHLDFVYWGSMVENQTIYGMWMSNASENFYRFNSATNAWQGVPGSHVMQAGTGYLTRARFNSNGWAPNPLFVYPWTANFIGKPRSGDVNLTLTADRHHLLGNPYPSTVDFHVFALQEQASYSASPFIPTIYYWTYYNSIDNNQYDQNDYATYNAALGTGTTVGTFTASRYITAGQGFFVKTRVGAASSGNFKNTQRVSANNSNFARSTNSTTILDRYWLNLNNSNGETKQIAVVHTADATNGYDVDYDSVTLGGNTAMNFYSVVETYNIAIQGRAPMQLTDIIPIGYNAIAAGNYSINLSDFEGVFTTQDIFLQDTQTNTIHNIKTAPYNFVTTAGTFNSRFNILYQNTTLSNPVFSNENQVVVASDKEVSVYSSMQKIKKIEVFDLVGRNVLTIDNVNANTKILNNIKANNVALIIKITLENGIQIVKKIVF